MLISENHDLDTEPRALEETRFPDKAREEPEPRTESIGNWKSLSPEILDLVLDP